jgi:hypothetical protein
VQALCAPLADPEFGFAARARLAVEYSDAPQRMSVARLDRHGLIASVADDVRLPPLGLPRAARVLSDGQTLCELRLVARALARPSGRPLELTMQPSRADDDLSFWQALYARRHLYPETLTGMGCIAGRPTGLAHLGRAPLPEETAKRVPIVPGTADCHGSSPTPGQSGCEPMDADIGCEAVFELADSNEALFLSEWLEYHFAEVAALARAASYPADLRDLRRYRTGTQVTVLFSYRRGSRTLQRTTDEVCGWIARETERLFGMSLRYESLDAREGIILLTDGHPRSASLASKHRRHSRHSFSSK